MIDGRWTRFDPTPQVLVERQSTFALFLDMLRMKWNRYVVAFSTSDQKEIVRIFSLPFKLLRIPDIKTKGILGIIYILLPTISVLLILFLLRNIHFRRYGFITAQYVRLRNAFKKKGVKLTPSLTPSEVKRAAVNFNVDSKVEEFVRLYEEHRFGGREMRREDRVRYKRLLKEIIRQNTS